MAIFFISTPGLVGKSKLYKYWIKQKNGRKYRWKKPVCRQLISCKNDYYSRIIIQADAVCLFCRNQKAAVEWSKPR